jgi:hypothetical protein
MSTLANASHLSVDFWRPEITIEISGPARDNCSLVGLRDHYSITIQDACGLSGDRLMA